MASSVTSLFPFSVPQDVAERRRALEPEQSFIVQAPAGSGKTELLIQRFLTLLARVDDPEEVVAITFTKKAAGEMRDRVLASLARAQSGEPLENPRDLAQNELALAVLQRSHERKWDLLRNAGRLRIDTIDALSNAIVRSMPWLSRFGAMPEPVEDSGELYRIAASHTVRLLAGAGRDAESIRILLAHLDVNVGVCERLIAQMLSRREQWLPIIIAEDIQALRPVLEANMAELVRLELQQVQSMLPDIAVRELPRAIHLERLPTTDALALGVWRDLSDKLLTLKGDWRKKVSGPEGAVVDVLRSNEKYEPLREALHTLRELPPPYYQDNQWQVLEALFHALKLAAANLRVVFQSRGQVDFSEITLAALSALGPVEQPTDLALSLGHRIRHLLVDEFQDTSNSQRELLLKLTAGWDDGDGRTLFLVGDPMQSIYRFREAEVGVFLETRKRGLGVNLRPEPLTIHVNFRSSPEIVNWANACFKQAFPTVEDVAMGAVSFEESVAFRWESGVVRTHPLFDKDDEAEAALVADLIGAARAEQASQSIAVLVRARPHLKEIVKELKRRGWKYRAVKVDTLAESPVVRDLLALTRALVHLADRPSWLAILRAPWCGLTLADLDAIAGWEHKAAIWTLLRSPGLRLSADGAARLRRFLHAIDPVMSARRRAPLRQWVEGAWIRLGGPACCCSSDAERVDAAEFLNVLEEFDQGGDLPEFDSIEQRLRELFTNPDPEADPTLQVMTIHQAKGLEFDTVILPGLGKAGRPDDTRLMHWLRNGDRLVLAPVPKTLDDEDPIYKYLAAVEARKESNELARLLYVATTRARRNLHLIGQVGIRKGGEMARPDRRSLLYRMWPMVEEEFAAAFASRNAAGPGASRVASAAPEQRQNPKLRRVATGWTAPLPASNGAPVLPDELDAEQSFDWAGNTLRHIGVLTHACLHRCIRERGDAAWVRLQRAGIRRWLLSLGVPPGECAEASAKVEAALLNTLADSRGAWTLSAAHQESQSELALTGRLGGEIIRGVVDRTFVDENGFRWIIDYKTSTHEGSGLEWFLDHEQTRYRGQLERYGRLFRAMDDRPIKLGLYFPLLGGWREWDLP